jgi:hypothetical protein
VIPVSHSQLPFRQDALPIDWQPYPHILADDFLLPDVFEKLRASFPGLHGRDPERPTEYTLFWGDDEFDALVERCAEWGMLVRALDSQAFVDYSARQLAPVVERFPCKLDLEKLHWISYQEPRDAKERDDLEPPNLAPNEVYCRIDLHRAFTGYKRRLHLDHLRRFSTMLIYFDDAEEIGMRGGELVLHSRYPELPLLHKLGMKQAPFSLGPLREAWAKTFRVDPRRNRMVLFPCTHVAWHSVPEIRETRLPRTFLQIRVSAATPIWL